jgi:hypothetical protein
LSLTFRGRCATCLFTALLSRCIEPVQPLREVSQFIPNPWRNRIKIETKAPIDKTPVVESNRNEKEKAVSSPVVVKLESPYTAVIEPSETITLPQRPCASSVMRIPGALSIDPLVRAAAQSANLNVSENAVWLLIVGAKEYANSVLRNCVDWKKSISVGEVPKRPPVVRLGQKEAVNKKDPTRKAGAQPKDKSMPTQRISALDVHTFTANMPVGATTSLGGAVSRLAYEHSLVSSLDTSYETGGRAPDDLRDFIMARITNGQSLVSPAEAKKRGAPTQAQVDSTINIKEKEDPNAKQKEQTASVKGRKSPFGGKGRGAKDLASLRARSSTIKSTAGAVPGNTDTHTTVPTQETQSAVSTSISMATAGAASAGAAADTTKLSQSPPSSTTAESSSAPNQPASPAARRGKGFGVKNLAAMLARTSSSGGGAPAASASAPSDNDAEGNAPKPKES